jgi:transmembrane sensor
MELNYNILRNAIDALPKYKMPDPTWASLEKSINKPMHLTPEQSDSLWLKIEANLSTTALPTLPNYSIPVDIWDNIETQLQPATNTKVIDITSANNKKIAWQKPLALAMGLALLVGIGISLFKNNTTTTTLLSFDGTINKTMAFEDGSIVISEDKAMVNYPASFAKNNRTIEQKSGKAFFEITKNAEKPFTINCPAGDITVLGTSFTTAVGVDSFMVIVKTGKVQVSNSKFKINLLPGEKAVLYKDELKQPIYTEAPKADTSKTTIAPKLAAKQPLEFTDKSIVAIIKDIELNYNCKVNYNETALKKIKVSGRIPQADAATMLRTLCEVADLNYSEKENIYTITLRK